MRRLITLIVGLTGLGLLLVGAPLILWTVGKDLLPDHVPSPGEVWDALLGPDTGRLFIGALVLIGTVAWVIMAAAIVLEIPAALTGRPMPRIRGLGWRPSLGIREAVLRTLDYLVANPWVLEPEA